MLSQQQPLAHLLQAIFSREHVNAVAAPILAGLESPGFMDQSRYARCATLCIWSSVAAARGVGITAFPAVAPGAAGGSGEGASDSVPSARIRRAQTPSQA